MDIVSKIAIAEFFVIIALHFFYSRQIHKLLDKLMSRDYRDYHSVSAAPKKDNGIKVQLPNEVPEDLRSLQGFQIP